LKKAFRLALCNFCSAFLVFDDWLYAETPPVVDYSRRPNLELLLVHYTTTACLRLVVAFLQTDQAENEEEVVLKSKIVS
jgi:hypothetical protein